MLTGPEHIFTSEQFIPRPRAEVFEFFSSEKNLEALTPPWLNFKVLNKSTPQIQAGTLINYQLKLYGLPIRWQTLIEIWEPGVRFVDTQLRGPYKKWHHTHTFQDVDGGTMMADRVIYQMHGGRLGDLAAGWKVHRDVHGIFNYRKEKIAEIF